MAVRVLLTNDDGPPDIHESPYVLGLYQHLTRNLGWDVKVVLPNAQKSWIAKAYHIKQTIRGWYYYPKDNGQGEVSVQSRPLKAGEIAEWILLDGTPATCSNVALHNLYPGQIDLVISGPNVGWNISSYALSSGTIGAALSSSLSKTRAIALSYGTVTSEKPTELFEPSHVLSCNVSGTCGTIGERTKVSVMVRLTFIALTYLWWKSCSRTATQRYAGHPCGEIHTEVCSWIFQTLELWMRPELDRMS